MKWYVALSLLGHAVIGVLILYQHPMYEEPNRIELTPIVVKRPSKASSSEGLGSGTPAEGKGFLSNRSEYKGDIGDKATADNYLERLKALIEPEWRRNVAKRVAELHRAKKPYKCMTCINILLLSTGSYDSLVISLPCHDGELNRIATNALDRGYPPPPKNLLHDNRLTIEWCFEVK